MNAKPPNSLTDSVDGLPIRQLPQLLQQRDGKMTR